MRRLLVLLACSLLFLAGCGGGGDSSPDSGSLPTASGSYGDKPTLTFPKGKAPAKLEKKVLHQGDGKEVAKGDLLVADYLGQVWGGKVFDNSYDRKAPAAFPIGVGQVIPGWDETLVGVKAGSRVLVSVPPDKGYGSSGNPNAGIKGTDTIVFVVDVVASYAKDAAGDPDATPQKAPSAGPQVRGALGAQPTVTVPAGTPKPKQATTRVLAKGSGPAVKSGLIIVQYQAVDWSGKVVESTWQSGTPAGVPVGTSQPSVFDRLQGVPVGSRVLLQTPAKQVQGQSAPALAVALDIVAQPGTAKEAAH